MIFKLCFTVLLSSSALLSFLLLPKMLFRLLRHRQMELHRGAGRAEKRSAGLDVAPAELPAGVRRDQVPDPGEEESHRRHPVHGQRPGGRDGAAETPLHHGGSPLSAGAQAAAPAGA